MSEQEGQEQGQQQGQSRGRGGGKQQSASSTQQPERGNTTIQNPVVSRISGLAAQEVEGIRMGGAGSQTASGILGGITGSSGSQTRGVSTEVGQEEVAVDLTLTAEYGKTLPQLVQAVRQNVINRLENLTGLRVLEANVDVVDIYFPQPEEAQQQIEGAQGQAS